MRSRCITRIDHADRNEPPAFEAVRLKILICRFGQTLEFFEASLGQWKPDFRSRMILKDLCPKSDPKVVSTNAQLLHNMAQFLAFREHTVPQQIMVDTAI